MLFQLADDEIDFELTSNPAALAKALCFSSRLQNLRATKCLAHCLRRIVFVVLAVRKRLSSTLGRAQVVQIG